eukprot:COSAG04_NODE_529_length_13029_cov_3.203248_9_plen_379_part_00
MEAQKIGAITAKLGLDLSAEEVEAVAVKAQELVDAAGDDGVPGPTSAMDSLDDAVARAGCGPFSLAPAGESTAFTISGTVSPGYEPVKEAFADNFRQGLERDAQLVIYKDGAVVVDLWGSSDEEGVSTAPEGGYDGDTLQIVYSSGKAIAATVMAMAVDRGLLQYDDPVAEHWPEFAQNGKEHITLADVLRHDAGLAQFHETITEDDVRNQGDPNGEMARIIAKQEPWTWSGGPDKGTTPRIYHAISRGCKQCRSSLCVFFRSLKGAAASHRHPVADPVAGRSAAPHRRAVDGRRAVWSSRRRFLLRPERRALRAAAGGADDPARGGLHVRQRRCSKGGSGRSAGQIPRRGWWRDGGRDAGAHEDASDVGCAGTPAHV